ncbi:MAG: nucleotide exchange factor GrpE [Candidatus Hydrogenedentes bacterium]|nr:nucleotide exchange factor GrpE [Candidatus Hydrogenedentota bacterium]
MSRTVTKVHRRNGWFLGRVIRMVAQATVAEFWERLQSEGWCPRSEIAAESQGPSSHFADPHSPEAEVKHLLRMHDELVKLLEHFEARAGVSKRQRRRLRQELRLTANLIARNLECLHALGVAPMKIPEFVDFRLHDPMWTVPTHVAADDGRVTDVYLQGFASNGQVVRQAKVAVLKYVPKPDSQPRKESQV